MSQIKDIAITKIVANDSDFLVMQSPSGETYKITRANFLAGLFSGVGNNSNNTINRCLFSNGATAIASSSFDGYPVSSIINGNRKGIWGNGDGWNSSGGGFPQWVVINFDASYSISKINIFTLQDAYNSPSEPTPDMTFSNYGVTAFDVQYWNGTTWATIQSFIGNNKIWTQAIFSPVTTNKIRIYITAATDANARLIEVEAY
ncbi:discoidin domain-containing protein [Nostoc sp.]|uniref:discoidin domain-containing protein n=1 Tax=Nostoc sp. TaxID=1180 RepID=UPI002FFA7C96